MSSRSKVIYELHKIIQYCTFSAHNALRPTERKRWMHVDNYRFLCHRAIVPSCHVLFWCVIAVDGWAQKLLQTFILHCLSSFYCERWSPKSLDKIKSFKNNHTHKTPGKRTERSSELPRIVVKSQRRLLRDITVVCKEWPLLKTH